MYSWEEVRTLTRLAQIIYMNYVICNVAGCIKVNQKWTESRVKIEMDGRVRKKPLHIWLQTISWINNNELSTMLVVALHSMSRINRASIQVYYTMIIILILILFRISALALWIFVLCLYIQCDLVECVVCVCNVPWGLFIIINWNVLYFHVILCSCCGC